MDKPLGFACVLFASVCCGLIEGQTAVKLHDGGLWSTYTTVPSVIWTNPASNQEAADDFNVVGAVTRVVANGSGCWQCAAPALAGAWVRFYAWQAGLPGALQYQAFVAAGTQQLLYNASNPEVLDITLPSPFQATGQHFVSVQASFVVAGYWSVWIADYNAATGAPVKFRDNLTSSSWGSYNAIGVTALNADLDLELWGIPANPPAQPVDPCGPWDVLSPAPPAGANHTILRDLKVIAPNDVWVAGTSNVGPIGNISALNVAWHWDGAQWTESALPNPGANPNNGLYAIDAAGPNDVFAAGYQTIPISGGWYGQQVEVLRWNGSQWSLMPNTPLPPSSIGAGVTGAHVNDVSARTASDVWFAGFWIDLLPSGFTQEPGLLMHYDGSSFTLTNVPFVVPASTQGQSFTNIEAIAANDVWATGYRYGLSTPAVPTGAPLLFHWNGSQWSSSSPPVPTPSVFSAITSTGPNDVWILGYHTPSPGVATPFMIKWNGSGWNTMPAPPGGGSLKAFAPNDLYAGGSSVWHYDGSSWTEVQSFPGLSFAAFSAIDGVAPCQLWGAGQQSVIGQPVPFVARQDSVYWEASVHGGCVPAATPGNIQALSPPVLGTYFYVGLSDPAQALSVSPVGGLTYWVVSVAPFGASGCGTPVPGLGLGGSNGELLIDLGGVVFTSGPFSWTGGAATSTHYAILPSSPQLAGIRVYSQGALLDAINPGHAILTPALDFRVGY